jgi:hypothetical protein
MELNRRSTHKKFDISKEWIENNPDLKGIAQDFSLAYLNTQLEKRNFDSEFRILCRITETNKHLEKIVEYCPAKSAKNRYCSVIPCKYFF